MEKIVVRHQVKNHPQNSQEMECEQEERKAKLYEELKKNEKENVFHEKQYR